MSVSKSLFNKNISISFFEQIIQNLGNFIFFLSVAKIVGPEQFGLFSIFYVGSQLIYSFSFQWILLPITSKNLTVQETQLVLSIKKKLLIGTIPSIIFCILYGYFIINSQLEIWQFCLIFIIGMLMILYDILRYFLIRLRKVKILIYICLFKYLVCFLSLLFFIFFYELNYLHTIISYLLGFLFAFVWQLLFLRKKIFLSNIISKNLQYDLDAPLLNLSLANIFNTSTMTIVFNKIDIVAFGALQAFRSIVNFFPIILQFLETHVSAIKVLKNETNIIQKKWLYIYILITLFIGYFLYGYKDLIVLYIFGKTYLYYEDLLFLIFIVVSIQNLSRIYSIELRLKHSYRVFNFSSFILHVASAFIIVIYLINKSVINYQFLVLFMLITSIFQLAIFIYFKFFKI